MRTEPLWLKVPAAARLTGLSAHTLRRMCRRGRIEAQRATGEEGGRGHWLIRRDSLEHLRAPHVS